MGDWLSTASATNVLLILVVISLYQIGKKIDVMVDRLIALRKPGPDSGKEGDRERRLEEQHRMLRILCEDVRLLQLRVDGYISSEIRRSNPDISLRDETAILEDFRLTSLQKVRREISGN